MTIFFTSDSHFGHKNVIQYCNRSYTSVEHMNASMVDSWNSVVKHGDIVYHLGDFSFMKEEATLEVIKSLKGNITLIMGNHDKHMSPKVMKMFTRVVVAPDVRGAL